MEVLSRYQVLPREGPLPWFSGSPMQLHTVQLVLDQLSGRVLLQILAQNMTDQPMKSVCLRITCRDAAGTVLQEFPAVLLKNIYAAPHGTFHNRQNLYLPTGTASCDLLPERVFFQDGQVWDRLSAGPMTAASHACRPRRIGRRRTAAGCPAGGLSQRLLLRRA